INLQVGAVVGVVAPRLVVETEEPLVRAVAEDTDQGEARVVPVARFRLVAWLAKVTDRQVVGAVVRQIVPGLVVETEEPLVRAVADGADVASAILGSTVPVAGLRLIPRLAEIIDRLVVGAVVRQIVPGLVVEAEEPLVRAWPEHADVKLAASNGRA